MTNELKKWSIDSSKYLIKDKFLTVRSDACTTPEGGKVDRYFVFEYPEWANCLVIDTDNNAIMLKHYRHAVQKYIPELVSGGIEAEDPSPESGIRRELEEELGYTGGKIYQVGVSYPNPASHTNKVYSFLAIGGSCTQEPSREAGESMHIATVFFALNFIRRS